MITFMYKITAAVTLILALAGAGCASDRVVYHPSAYPALQPDYGAHEGGYQEQQRELSPDLLEPELEPETEG
jgi:hypothetical protein